MDDGRIGLTRRRCYWRCDEEGQDVVERQDPSTPPCSSMMMAI
jgi:hypothetical protein